MANEAATGTAGKLVLADADKLPENVRTELQQPLSTK